MLSVLNSQEVRETISSSPKNVMKHKSSSGVSRISLMCNLELPCSSRFKTWRRCCWIRDVTITGQTSRHVSQHGFIRLIPCSRSGVLLNRRNSVVFNDAWPGFFLFLLNKLFAFYLTCAIWWWTQCPLLYTLFELHCIRRCGNIFKSK